MIKKTSPQAFFFSQEFDRFAKAAIPGSDAESALAYEPPTSLRTSSILSLSILGSNERAGLAEQDGVYKGGLVAESGVAEHFDASVDDAFGFSEARTDSGESSATPG